MITDLTCNICRKVFANRGSLNNHKKQHHFASNWKCTKCSKPFHSQEQLNVHVLDCLEEEKAVNEGEVRCHFCPQVFKSRDDAMSHRKTVHPTTYYQCRRCDKNFNSKYDLMMHGREAHVKAPKIVCEVCNVVCGSTTRLQVV